MPLIYNYLPDAGALYARSFALFNNVPADWRLFYYDPGDDCTNFISQCVWAAYGGWIPGFMSEITAANERRILGDVRQVKGIWYGSKSHIGSIDWCRVVDFFNFVTDASKPYGPQARKIAEGDWQSVDPGVIRRGDVIQMVVADYTRERYGHGLYVTKAGPAWEETLICCHTIDRLDEPLSSFARYPRVYEKLRVLRFFPAAFER